MTQFEKNCIGAAWVAFVIAVMVVIVEDDYRGRQCSNAGGEWALRHCYTPIQIPHLRGRASGN
jgi:hypothetical protein